MPTGSDTTASASARSTGTIINAIEPRLKANVFLGGGLQSVPSCRRRSIRINFVPRIRAPTLMVNGDSDFQFPLEDTQRP